MIMQEIRDLARDRGLKPAKLKKIELVRKIQKEEGNFDCFASALDGYCDQPKCLWRDDCLEASKRSLAS